MPKTLTRAVLQAKKPATKTITTVLDPELGDQWRTAVATVEAAKTALNYRDDIESKQKLVDAEKEVDRLRPIVDDEAVEFKLQAIGRATYDELMRSHPATKEQEAEMGEKMVYNPDTFPPALVAASLVLEDDSDVTPDDIVALFDDPKWNKGELESLFVAALQVNSKNSVDDLGKGFAPMGA